MSQCHCHICRHQPIRSFAPFHRKLNSCWREGFEECRTRQSCLDREQWFDRCPWLCSIDVRLWELCSHRIVIGWSSGWVRRSRCQLQRLLRRGSKLWFFLAKLELDIRAVVDLLIGSRHLLWFCILNRRSNFWRMILNAIVQVTSKWHHQGKNWTDRCSFLAFHWTEPDPGEWSSVVISMNEVLFERCQLHRWQFVHQLVRWFWTRLKLSLIFQRPFDQRFQFSLGFWQRNWFPSRPNPNLLGTWLGSWWIQRFPFVATFSSFPRFSTLLPAVARNILQLSQLPRYSSRLQLSFERRNSSMMKFARRKWLTNQQWLHQLSHELAQQIRQLQEPRKIQQFQVERQANDLRKCSCKKLPDCDQLSSQNQLWNDFSHCRLGSSIAHWLIPRNENKLATV